MHSTPKHYKSISEDSLSRIWYDIALLLIFFVVVIIVCIKREIDIIEGLSSLMSINPFSALIVFVLLHIVFLIVKSVIYNQRKKSIVAHGKVIEGVITETKYVKVLIRSPGPTYNYKYLVKLSDGRTIDTEVYYEDFVEKDSISHCTVYEYNNHYYFTDFR